MLIKFKKKHSIYTKIFNNHLILFNSNFKFTIFICVKCKKYIMKKMHKDEIPTYYNKSKFVANKVYFESSLIVL